jgi:hypothetical protein
MEVFLDGFAAVAHHAGNLSIARHGSVMTPVQLIIAACVASVMMIVALMAGARVLVIVVFVPTCFVGLIAQVSMALFERMLSVLSMHVAGLKTLVLAQEETLLLARIVGASLAFATLTIFASTTSVVVLHTVQLATCRTCDAPKNGGACNHIALEAHGASHTSRQLGFFKLTVRNKAFAQARVVNQLKILCEQLERLFTKFAARVNVLRPVSPVEGHVKPFHGETCSRLLEVALR